MMEGVISGLTTVVTSDRFLTPIVEGAHRVMANSFDESMDLMVETYLDRFHHVYEWWNSPIPWDQARLWTHQLKGSGGTNRLATWSWKASKTPVPHHWERRERGSVWSSHLTDSDISSLSSRKHFFHWKAPIMEYNTPVTVTPRYSDALFIPTPNSKSRFKFDDSITIDNPGGTETTGAFTTAWTMWWTRTAPNILEGSFDKSIKKGIEDQTLKTLKKGTQSRSSTISTVTSYEEAMKKGREWVTRELYDWVEKEIGDTYGK